MGSSGHEEEEEEVGGGGAMGVFWAWVEGATGNMALALDGLVEQLRSWATVGGLSGVGLASIMDTLNTLLVGWMVFVAFILVLGTFFYFRFIYPTESGLEGGPQDAEPEGGEPQGRRKATEAKGGTGRPPASGKRARPAAAPPSEPARKPTIIPEVGGDPVSPPVATGADPDAVNWANNVFTWLYNGADGGPAVRKIWLDTINENTVKTAIETGILVEVVEVLAPTLPPTLSNMVIDCSPTDNVTITCDCDAAIFLRLVTTRTQGETTTESEYACVVSPMRGRLNMAAVTADLTAVVKFDGWPEVSLRLEGIRNNATGLDEQQMLEVIDEVLTSALRNSVLDVNFQSNKTFPKFRRARQAPDPIIPVGYDSMVRELQTHPPSAFNKSKKREFVPLHNEELVEAGESFTALPFSSTFSHHINLTLSEEQLIARNLNKYPSLENAEMEADEISNFCKSWEENYVPAAEVHNEDEESSEACVTDPQKEDSQTKNFVLVATNRSKLIDEPRITACIENEEEEPEIEEVLNCNEPEPCIRRGSRSPLLLGKPTTEESVQPEEEEIDEPFQLDKMDFTDKSLTGTSGFGPLPSLPGLQKGPFVSGACCVGVEINVAAEVPELELRVKTEAVGDSVACDLSECDQEDVKPIQPLLQTQLHNQSDIDDLSPCSVSDAANTPNGSQREPNPSPTSFPSLEPATSSASALSALMGNRDEENESGFSLVGNRRKTTGEDSGYLWDTSWINSAPSTQDSSTFVYEHVKDDINTNDGNFDREDLESSLANQVLPFQVTDPKQSEQPLIFQPDNFEEESLRSIDECMNESESVHEVHKFVNTGTQEVESGNRKFCLNEFTESIFKDIESEVSLSEEIVNDPAWEVAEIYETSDGSMLLDSLKQNERSEDFEKGSVIEVKQEHILSVHGVTADKEDTEISYDANMVCIQEYEAEIYDTNPVSGELDEENEIIPSGCGRNENDVQEFHHKDYDTLEEICKKANMQDILAEPFDRNSEKSNELSTAMHYHNVSEEMEKENIKKVTEGVLCNTPHRCEEIIKLADIDERVEDQSPMDKICKLDSEEEAVKEETSNNEACDESLLEEHCKNSTEVEETQSSSSKEKFQSPSGDHQFSESPEMASELLSNDTQEPIDKQSEYLNSVLHECREKSDYEPKSIIDDIDDKDPFSPDDDDFRYEDDENLTCGCSHECKCTLTENSSSDSEVEGITGKHPGKVDEYSPSEQNWRNSDIDLIVEAESFLVPGGNLDSSLNCNVKEAKEIPESVSLSHNLEDAQASPRTVSFRLQDAQVSAHDILLADDLQKAELLPQNSILRQSEEESELSSQEKLLSDTSRDIEESHQIQSNILSFSEGSLLTTKTHSVAALTQPDTTSALTAQQGKSHTRKDNTTGNDFMKELPLTSGRPQWTRSLPYYPVYGAYFVATTLPSGTTGQSMGIPGLNGKRLLVKIVKATGVGCEKLVSEAYAVVEMDEPPQKFTTSVIKETSSPFWDEQFLFDLSGGTLELLFEVYDKKDGNFLGLGIVGIEELVATPSQRQIIPLQSRPYENDEVSGSLTVEFLFLDRADLPEHALRSSATSQSLTSRGDIITTTTTTYVKVPDSQDVFINGGDGVAAAALRDIEEKKVVVANNASKSTMIIHASRKPDEEDGHLELPLEDLTALITTATPTTPTITTTSTHSVEATSSLSPTTTTATTTATSTANTDATDPIETDERGRSRGIRRKRDSFFGTLKKRFSRSKVRSKSVDPSARDMSMDHEATEGRSLSIERSANLNRASGLLSVPANVGGDGGSTRSSLSDASAISSSSTRTYVNEASTLIVETSENGVFKHYLIPLSLQQKSKWRKKGLKLHIFGEHTFIAKHMSSSTPCEVCQKTLGRRFGKQGYVCRDCGFKCHKPCHVKTDTICPNSTVNSMDLEYVKDVREERRAWIRKVKSS